MTYNVSIPVRR